jgi:hypothetical protein
MDTCTVVAVPIGPVGTASEVSPTPLWATLPLICQVIVAFPKKGPTPWI